MLSMNTDLSVREAALLDQLDRTLDERDDLEAQLQEYEGGENAGG